jgi:hypothetical protein
LDEWTARNQQEMIDNDALGVSLSSGFIVVLVNSMPWLTKPPLNGGSEVR